MSWIDEADQLLVEMATQAQFSVQVATDGQEADTVPSPLMATLVEAP